MRFLTVILIGLGLLSGTATIANADASVCASPTVHISGAKGLTTGQFAARDIYVVGDPRQSAQLQLITPNPDASSVQALDHRGTSSDNTSISDEFVTADACTGTSTKVETGTVFVFYQKGNLTKAEATQLLADNHVYPATLNLDIAGSPTIILTKVIVPDLRVPGRFALANTSAEPGEK